MLAPLHQYLPRRNLVTHQDGRRCLNFDMGGHIDSNGSRLLRTIASLWTTHAWPLLNGTATNAPTRHYDMKLREQNLLPLLPRFARVVTRLIHARHAVTLVSLSSHRRRILRSEYEFQADKVTEVALTPKF